MQTSSRLIEAERRGEPRPGPDRLADVTLTVREWSIVLGSLSATLQHMVRAKAAGQLPVRIGDQGIVDVGDALEAIRRQARL